MPKAPGEALQGEAVQREVLGTAYPVRPCEGCGAGARVGVSGPSNLGGALLLLGLFSLTVLGAVVVLGED